MVPHTPRLGRFRFPDRCGAPLVENCLHRHHRRSRFPAGGFLRRRLCQRARSQAFTDVLLHSRAGYDVVALSSGDPDWTPQPFRFSSCRDFTSSPRLSSACGMLRWVSIRPCSGPIITHIFKLGFARWSRDGQKHAKRWLSCTGGFFNQPHRATAPSRSPSWRQGPSNLSLYNPQKST